MFFLMCGVNLKGKILNNVYYQRKKQNLFRREERQPLKHALTTIVH